MTAAKQIIQLFLKQTPEVNHAVTTQLFKETNMEKMTEKELQPFERYLNSLQVHREYLEFFQIGVIRDQKSKI